jgi:HEAT repeat protein
VPFEPFQCGQTERRAHVSRATPVTSALLNGGGVVVVGSLAALLLGAGYWALDLREPEHTRRQLAAFRAGEEGAWDDYKMDPPRSRRAVPALLEGMRDPSPVVRERAIIGVCGISADLEVLSELRVLSNDPAESAREAAQVCLRNKYHVGQ